MDGRHLENRPNVTARWRGTTDKDALMLMEHTDTVVIGDRSQWSFDPLAGEIRDGKIWGRGASDDKYALATALFLIRILLPKQASIRDMQEAARMVSGRELTPCGSCLSDLSVILKYGSKEAYGFGIGRDFSEYGGAHQPDEFIKCENLLEYAKIMAAYVVKTLG